MLIEDALTVFDLADDLDRADLMAGNVGVARILTRQCLDSPR